MKENTENNKMDTNNKQSELEAAKKSFKYGIPKIFALIYGVIALPLNYYGTTYIEMVRANPTSLMLLTIFSTGILIAIIIFVQKVPLRDINLILTGETLSEDRLRAAKAKALNYPFYVAALMAFGFTVMQNAFVLIPSYILTQVEPYNLIVTNLFVTSAAFSGTLISFFMAESSVSGFLRLPQISRLEPKGSVFRPGITAKIIAVCISIIFSFGLNFIGTAMLTQIHDLSQTERVLNMALAGVIVIISGMIVAFLFARSLNKQLSELINVLNEVGKGKLSGRVTVANTDETGELSRSLNSSLDNINGLIKNVIERKDSLIDLMTNKVAADFAKVASATGKVNTGINSVKSKSANQSASVSETIGIMEQIVTNIEKLGSHVESQGASVSQSSAAVEQMIANIKSVIDTLSKNAVAIENLSDSSEAGRNNLNTVLDNVQKIAHDSEGLLEINAVMENIASQTNLLSMNAAIQAAHAGDAGKGFAVVAGEIRKLAESSNKQSKTIGEVLKKIKASIDKISVSSDDVLEKFKAIDENVKVVVDQGEDIRRAMKEQDEGSRQVLEAMGRVKETTRLVSEETRDMRTGSGKVIQKSRNLGQITQELSLDIEEMGGGVTEQNSAIKGLNEAAGENNASLQALSKDVSKFKVA